MSNHMDYEINKELGECYLFMGDMDKAEQYYQKAAGCNGVHPDPYLGLATIAVQRGELDKALDLYHRASEAGESDKASAGIGLILMEQADHAQAFDHFIKALAINPENMIAIFGLVQVGNALGKLEEVIPHLDNFLAVNPLKSDIRYTLAGCLVSMGREQDAVRHLEYIIANEPEYGPARELYDQIAA